MFSAGRFRLLFAYFLAALFEGAACWALLPLKNEPSFYAGAALLHILSAVSFLVLTPSGKNLFSYRRHYYFLSAMLVFFLPVIGLPGAFCSVIAARGLLRAKGLAESFEKKKFSFKTDAYRDMTGHLNDFLVEELSVQPLMDILRGDDPDLKRGAVKLLRNMGTPEAVRMLKKCLLDESMEVRFYAHNALTAVEEQYTKELAKAGEAVRDGAPENQAILGKTQLRYASSGLLDENLKEHYLSLARENLEKAYAALAEPDLAIKTGELCLETRDYPAAKLYFLQAANHEATRVDAFLGLCRANFESGDLAALAENAKAIASAKDFHDDDPAKLALLQFWSAQREPRQEANQA